MKKAIRELELCDHTFLLFNDQMEFMHCLIPFIREGINKNQSFNNHENFIQFQDSHFYKWEFHFSASVGVESPTEVSMFSFS